MNPVLAGEIGGRQSAAVKRREKLTAPGGIGADRAAARRRNAALLHGRVFTTACRRLIGGLPFTAYTLLELAELETRLAEPDRIDPGEKHLLAHAMKKAAAVWHVSASDRAAVKAGSELGLLDKFVSLEALARVVGMSPQLKQHFTEKWLGVVRTEILMGGA